MKLPRASEWLSILCVINSYVALVRAASCDPDGPTVFEVEDQEGLGTLRDAVNCTNGEQIEATWTGSVPVTSTIRIGEGTFLTITGADEAEAVASFNARLFQVDSGGGLQLTSMTLSKGSAIEGGAILSESGAVSVKNCEFYSNTASSGGGGAIWATGGSVNITGSYFHNNTASGHKGGAVYAIDVDLTVRDDSWFEHNWAEEGGAVFCGGSVPVSSGGVANCSFDHVLFLSNNASSTDYVNVDDFGFYDWTPPLDKLHGGGGLSLVNTTAVLWSCTFESNFAQLSGAGVHADMNTTTTMDGCTFSNNSTPGFGGGATVSSATFNRSTAFEHNEAGRHGGAVFAWDWDGRVEVDSFRCLHNTGGEQGGCLYAGGDTLVHEEVLMEDNRGYRGGCIYSAIYSHATIKGGNYSTCYVTDNGAFLFASKETTVVVDGVFVQGCIAERRAGVAYSSGGSGDEVGALVTIVGGTFIDNRALELGGALVAWGTTVNVYGGIFANNSARYYGGFVFLEESASILCDGATIRDNYAGDQGGGVYARDAMDVDLSRCDLLDNVSPQGAGAYLTHVERASFDNLNVSGNIPSSGSSVFIAESVLIADGVNFGAGNASALDATNRAVQSDASSFFHAHDCTFEDWDGDAVVNHGGQSSGSLKLNTCNFRRSSSSMTVISSESEAEIRNAHVSQDTFDNAIDPLALVDNALSCSSQGACGIGACVNSSLGVLCECLLLADGDACLDDGPTLWLKEESPPANATIYPQNVEFTLAVYADTEGSTDAIWEVDSSSDRLELSVVPSSGVISPGEKTVIVVTGEAVDVNTGGDVTNTFELRTVTNGSISSAIGSSSGVEIVNKLTVTTAVYLCDAFEVAMPDDSAFRTCEQCSELDGGEGLNCEDPGATLELLTLLPGYWRSSNVSERILSCDFPEVCSGGTEVTTSDGYCAPGSVGPYCAVCDDGYGRGVGNRCHACTGTTATLLIVLGTTFCLVGVSFILVVVMFLIGGLDAVDHMRDSIVSSLTFRTRRGRLRREQFKGNDTDVECSTRKAGTDFLSQMAPVDSFGREALSETAEAKILEAKDADEDKDGGIAAHGESQKTAGEAADGRGARASGTKDHLPTKAEENGSSETFKQGRDHSGHGAGGQHLATGEVMSMSMSMSMSNRRPNPSNPHPAAVEEQRSGCCGLGDVIKRWMSRLPLDKLKILVVVWQILTVFPSIASVDFPPIYSSFLSWIDVVNLDLGQIFSASCLITNVTHYERLLAVTLIPLLLGLVLVITYRMALKRAGIGTAGIIARRAAWSRHLAAGLLLTFLVFTSASTTIFRTFSCDDDAIEGESFLRADYSVECGTTKHIIFSIYAGLMILVYPVGIPSLYFFILWTNRESLNPTLRPRQPIRPDNDDQSSRGRQHVTDSQASQANQAHECQEGDDSKVLEEKIRQRKTNPDLVPSMFLWKDFGPDLYYYEVVECGRRILLTSVLIFIAPQSSAQAAMACIFAFGSLLGFELLRPHLDPTDSWLYRLGCVVIFLSNFLALLIKVDAAGSGRKDFLGALIVLVNIILVVAVIVTSWFATQQSVDDSQAEDNSLAVARGMITAERLAAKSVRTERHKGLDDASSGHGQSVPVGTVTPSSGTRPVISHDPARSKRSVNLTTR